MSQFVIPTITHPFDVEVTLPGSKSIALRQLAIAAMTDGTSVIRGLTPCDDVDAMLECLERLGVTQEGDYSEMTLTGPMQFTGEVTLNARMSGASTRLLIGLAALRKDKTTIDGHPSLRVRTNAPLFDVLNAHGCIVDSDGGKLPATIHGHMKVEQALTIDGSISSQYITAVMMIAPLLTDTELNIHIADDLVSRPYLDITREEMRKKGVSAVWINEQQLLIKSAAYQPGTVVVEGDATASTYFAALATLHKSRVTLTNLGKRTAQGDYAFLDIMESLGASVQRFDGHTVIQGPDTLQTLNTIDMTRMPDAALTLIAMGPLLPEGIQITGLSSLHHKECDRLECPAAEFGQLGVQTTTTEDSIRLTPLSQDLTPHELNTYHDHRMAMAFSVFASGTQALAIDDERVVDKTFPAYWDEYRRLVA